MASLLQKYGVDFCLLEAQPKDQHFHHPQAHFLNTRTIEVLKHFTPSIYQKVAEAMPPVEEWKRFHFGPSMMAANVMATVQHPVHAPLVAGSNANGLLLENYPQGDALFHADASEAVPLSDVSVGHLAQHTFSRILFDDVQLNLAPTCALEFGSRVVHAEQNTSDLQWQVTTDTGQKYQAPIVVAADGVKSTWRQKYLNIGMSGQPTIQHLINVHFSLTESPPSDCMPPAMLYTIFSSKVLAMVVRHSPTEYVMQIPYFPPYQSVEADFSEHQVTTMIRAALGNFSNELEFNLRSVRPWTMGSLVADSYAKQNVFLVGDAAHVFPPAGGFGMNTGIQDVVALAWRLALLVNGNKVDPSSIYTKERQSVAYQNAALSVRNYQRVLGVMKSCYLDERNLPILLKSLEASARLGVPVQWQRVTFQNLFRAALLPLQMLQDAPSSPYSKHVTNNLRKLLRAGQGLPLLFPNHELAFTYPTHQQASSANDSSTMSDWTKDSIADPPQLIAGRLFPHLPCRVIGGPAYSFSSEDEWSTTRDLPARLATDGHACSFCLLSVLFAEKQSGQDDNSVVATLSSQIEQRLGISVLPAMLLIGPESATVSQTEMDSNVTLIWTSQREWQRRSLLTEQDLDRPLFVLIRPDGHVAAIVRGKGSQEEAMDELVLGASYSLGLDAR